MKFFEKNFPEKLISSILASQIIGKKVKLQQKGKEFQGLCPFHNEKTPSFTVNDQKGFYHCFGCQAHGNIIDFTMKTDSLDFKEAVLKLAQDNAIEVPFVNAKQEEKKENDYEILEKICEIFQENLKNSYGAEARKYIKNRGFNEKTVKKFRLGFAPNSYDFLHQKLAQIGFTEGEILASGIIAKNDKGKIYDKFRNRIIFPIFDRKNRVIAFGGRVLGQDLPKYLNSSETKIFKKNQTLYNINNAYSAIFKEKSAIIVEGYIDAISLSENGVENAVAGLGTALSQEHFSSLFKMCDKIILCLDGDEAGIRAAKRALEISLPIINATKNVEFIFLPNNLDPDDFIKKFGANKFRELLQNQSLSLSEAIFRFVLKDLEIDENKNIKAEEKAKIEAILSEKTAIIKDNLTKKHFSQFFKEKIFKMGFKTGKNFNYTLNKNKSQAKSYQNFGENFSIKPSFIQKNDEIFAKNYEKSDIFAKNIIALLIKYPDLANYRDENFDIKEIYFKNEDLSDIKDRIIEKIEENDEKNEKNLLLELENYVNMGYNIDIANIVKEISKDFLFDEKHKNSLQNAQNKMHILLLKLSLCEVEKDYQNALQEQNKCGFDGQDLENIALKIREISSYKKFLENKILEIESKNINS